MSAPLPLILASGSRYRAEMLERLGLPFAIDASDIDETPAESETADELVRRLARRKAEHVASRRPGSVVIGADQVAVLDGTILGKPGDREHAIERLRAMSGRTVDFLSGIAMVHGASTRVDVVGTQARFRALDDAEIARYVDRDRPYDCAGGMRSESLGIALLDSLSSDDPSALIGLPLIRVAEWLRSAGFDVP